MPRPTLRVPKNELDSFARLITLPAAKLEALTAALSVAELTLSLKGLARKVAPKVGLEVEEAFSILRVSAVLYRLKESGEYTLPDFLQQIQKAAVATGRDDLQKIDWEATNLWLAKIFGLKKPFGVIAKSLNVIAENASVYCDARILTDIRPVFPEDGVAKPDAMLVIHNLRIHYHADRGEIDTFHISLDSEDVESLRKVLERASTKEKALKESLVASGIPVLTVEREE